LKTYLFAFLMSGIVAAILTPLVARLGYRIQALDLPGEARKVHTRAVPRIGGIAVVAAFFVPIVGLAIYTNRISSLLYADGRLVVAFLAGSLGIVGLGIYDDLRGAGAKLKLVVQAIVAVTVWYAGFRIDVIGNPFGEAIQLGYLSLPITTIWIVGVVNALNLIDGLDGLASGVALFACIVLFGTAFVDNVVLLCLLLAGLSGALVGFLFFNFNPAKIFLGDSGSMFLGFVLAVASIWTQRKGPTAAALLIPILALGIPILDTTLSVVRRVGRGQSPFTADRDHLHHRLLAIGHTHRGAVLSLYTASAVFALGGLAMLDNDMTHRVIALSTVVAVVVILLRKVGVFHAPVAATVVAAPTSALRDELRVAVRRIRGAADEDEAWRELVTISNRLGLQELRLAWRVTGERQSVYSYPKQPDVTVGPYDWQKRMDLEEAGCQLGDFAVVDRAKLDRRRDADSEAFRSFAVELLAEALIDFQVAKGAIVSGESDSAQVVSLSDARGGRTTALSPQG